MIAYKGKSLKQRQIAKKKNRKSKIEARPVNDGHYMAFKQRWSLHGFHLAAIFGCYRSRIMPEIVSKLLRTAIAHAVLERCHKSSAIDFAVKTFDCLLEQPSGVIANELQRLKLEIKLQLCRLSPNQRVVEVLSALKSQNQLCGV